MLSTASPSALHSGIVTARFVATCEFYFEHFGFAPIEISGEFALLGRADGSRLAVLQAGGDGQPAALSQSTRGAGVWLAFESDDVDALHAHLASRGAEIVCDPETTLSGRRRCVVRDPNGVLVYVTSRHEAAPVSPPPSTNSKTHPHEDHRYRLRWLSCH
ncbi:MAG: VOC family protein [Opitutaceae bacterium]|nr:VOC family protein [Opitutaceae bacterium]